MRGINIMSPNQAISMLWGKIPGITKITFFSTFAIGMLVHGYMFTNLFLNHDAVYYYAQPSLSGIAISYHFGLGRWFQGIAAAITGSVPSPLFIGAISIFFVSITACLVTACLEMKSKCFCILTGAFLSTFPATGMIFTYMNSADNFYLSLLLACLAAYLCKKYRLGFIYGGISLALALGIYQAYITFTAGIFIIVLILDALSRRETNKMIFRKGVRYFACLILGLALYFLAVQFTVAVFNINLIAYNGVDQMGKTPLSHYPGMIMDAYRAFFSFFGNHPYGLWLNSVRPAVTWPPFGWLSVISKITFLLPLISIPLFIAMLADRVNILLLALLVILFPLAVNLVYVIGADGVYINMLYGLVLVFVLAMALAERMEFSLKGPGEENSLRKNVCALICWFLLLASILIPYNYSMIINSGYLKADLTMKQTYHFSAELAQQIKDAPGYREDIKIALIGAYSASDNPVMDSLTAGRQLSREWDTWPWDVNILINSYSYDQFFRVIMGNDFNINSSLHSTWSDSSQWLDDAFVDQYKDELSGLPIYPMDGSLRVIDDILFIRMGEEY